MSLKKILVSSLSILGVLSILAAFSVSSVTSKENAKYIGANKCKMCHKSDKKGDQYNIWAKGLHAKAYETLANEHSKEIAAKMGIKDPQKAPECLKCHVTAYSVDASLKEKTLKMEEGVSCESCHGPGSEYKSMSVMKDIALGKTDGTDKGYHHITAETCTQCHNSESPTFKGFVFEEKVKKIAHPMPDAYKKEKGYK